MFITALHLSFYIPINMTKQISIYPPLFFFTIFPLKLISSGIQALALRQKRLKNQVHGSCKYGKSIWVEKRYRKHKVANQ
jgi:hypothetical protein